MAAGAGHPGLPDPERLLKEARHTCAGARVCRVLQRVVPGSRLRRRSTSTCWRTASRTCWERAAQGQPLDARLSLLRAVLPGGGLHQPADHEAADGLLLQAEAGRLQGQHPARAAGHPAAGQHTIEAVWINGEPYSDFDPVALTVKLPSMQKQHLLAAAARLELAIPR